MKSNHGEECEIERIGEKMMQLTIQPHLFRDLNNIVKEEKEFYQDVCIEIQE